MWKLKLVIAIPLLVYPGFAFSQGAIVETSSTAPAVDCSQERFEIAQNGFRARRFGGSPEKLLKVIVDGCPSAFWIDRARAYLSTVQEDRATTLISIARYYQRLFVTGKSTSNRGAVSRFELILANYPHYSRTDYVLLILGNAYSSAGNNENARWNYKRLIAEFPASTYARIAGKHLDR